MLNNTSAVFSITEIDQQLMAANLARAQVPVAYIPRIIDVPPERNDDDDDEAKDDDDAEDSDFADGDDDDDDASRRRGRSASTTPASKSRRVSAASSRRVSAPSVTTIEPATKSKSKARKEPAVKVARPRRTAAWFTTQELEVANVSNLSACNVSVTC